MSTTQTQTTAATTVLQEGEVQKYRWPPFPSAPPNKTILSFADFKPKGICVQDSDDEDEVDGDGVKTVKLLNSHFLDPREKAENERAKRARKRRKGPQGPGMAPKESVSDELAKFWYEDWEDNIHRERVTPMNPATTTREDRFTQIITDFQTDRKFTRPVQSINDNFRMFVGLLENVQNPPGSKHMKGAQNKDMDEDMAAGSDEDDSLSGVYETAGTIPPPEPIPEVVATPEPEAEPAKEKQRVVPKKEKFCNLTAEEKMSRFLDDPERAIKMYFTSYSYERGLVWDPEKRRSAPVLIDFILKFILRHGTMKECERELQKALQVVERAKIEQPAIGEIAEGFPDPFMVACREHWGRCDADMWAKALAESDAKAANASPIKEDNKAEAESSKTEDMDVDVDVETRDEASWKGIEESEPNLWKDDAWGASLNAAEGEWGEDKDGWGSIDSTKANDWHDAEPQWDIPAITTTLKNYFGKLPDTHVMVRVESGLRQIQAVELPNPNSSSEFRKTVGVLVMAPWPERSNRPQTYLAYPSMLKDDVSEVTPIPAHDPLNDTIRAYVDPKTVERLQERLGMGINGYWVQVAQKAGAEDTAEPKGKKKSKSKALDSDSPLHWWYLEDSFQIMQTYWVE